MRKKTALLFALSAAFTLSACDSDPALDSKSENSQQAHSREVADKLTQQVAAARKKRVADVSYVLDIDLTRSEDAYKGSVDAAFTLKGSDKPLTLDFTGGTVSQVLVNGQSVEVDYSGYFVTLPAESLVDGENKVTISFDHPYGQDGTGLHRFVDPEDGNTYLYTYLWPYYSNRLFPNFDQPNLKATYEMTVTAPENWQVFSATREDEIKDIDGKKVWHFPQSKKFSSYIFSLHAGPYKVWEDQAGDVPIRLMARQSLAPYVQVEEWFGYTKMGLEHFHKYFDIKYPFGKYDQVIVPDFNIGAMENVAAVTFNERIYVQRGPSSRFERQRRAGTILHEMAHMWFGDLVTKNWWNGLWLNESFATLMSSIAVSQVPEFNDLWHDFYLNENLTAISADSLVSTHPVEVPVPSTADFFSVFDAITYDKGASVLNQLSHYVGKENFRLGVSNYLKEHSWGNTELEDFVEAQSKQSGRDLTPWAEKWLYQAGVNTLGVTYTCADNKISALSINQTAPADYPVLRHQKVQLALFSPGSRKGNMEPYAVLPIEIGGSETVVTEANGQACPEIAYPNYQGWGYAKIELDDASVKNLPANIKNVDDPLLRSMFWTALLGAPGKGQMDGDSLVNMIAESLETEENDRIINQLTSAMVGMMDSLERSKTAPLGTSVAILEKSFWEQLNKTSNSENTRLIYLQKYIEIVRSPEGLSNLAGLLNGSIKLDNMPISRGYRWGLIGRLAQRGDSRAKALLEAEKAADPSDSGKLAAIAAEASLPDLSVKKKWVAMFLDEDNQLPLSNQRAAMEVLFPANQGDLQLAMLPEMIKALPQISSGRDPYYQRSYARDLFTGVCSPDGVEQMRRALDKDIIGPTLYRFLAENVQMGEEGCGKAAGK